MKKYFISIVCLMCAVMVVVYIAKSSSSDMKKHEEQWEQLNNEVMNALEAGRYQEGIPLGEKAYQYALKNFGNTHTNTLTSMNNLAGLYLKQERFDEAEPLFKQALQLSEEALLKDSICYSFSISNLGELYVQQERFGEAEPLFKQALKLREKVLGKKDPNTLNSINNLAALYESQGRYEEAEPLFKQALQLREKVLGKENPDTLTSLNNLAGLYYKQKRYGKAEPLLKEALQLNEKFLGQEHPYYMGSLNNLAALYHARGRYGEAEPLFKESLQLREKILGKEHPDTLTTLNNLAEVYHKQGRYGEAEPLFKQALQLSEKVLKEEHPQILQFMNNLCGLYHAQGRYEEAESLCKKALQLREKVLGKEHPDTLQSLNNLPELYRKQGRFGEAETLLKEALQLREKVFGKEDPRTLNSLNNLAEIYHEQGRYGEAEVLFKQVIQLSEKVLGKEDPDTLTSLNNLAGLYCKQGRFGEAETLLKKTLQLREKVLGKENPDIMITQLQYIELMINMKKPAVAFDSLKNIENQLLSRSFQELYTTSQDRVRRLYLTNNSNFQSVVFSFSLKYPETEYQQFAANVMLRWKNVYSEENVFQHRLLNISPDPNMEKLKKHLTNLRTEFSLKIHNNAGKRDATEIWNNLQSTEYILREKAKSSKTELLVSTANLDQIIEHLPQNSALIEFRMFQEADFKTGKLEKLHFSAYLLMPNAKQQLFFEDIGEAEDVLSALNSEESYNILYQKLFGKFDKHIRNLKKIYIAPDGFLNLVPFHTLRLPDGKYWTERQQINILQTGRDLLSPPLANPSKLFVAVGGVDYGDMPKQTASAKGSDAPPMLNMRAAGELGTGLKYLENSLFEAKTIEDMFKDNYPDGKTVVLQGKDATEAALRNLTQAPKFLHLSTHGFYLETPLKKAEEWSEEEPLLLSGLALTGANRGLKGMTDDKGDDGLLYSIEVLSMNLQGTELVSLSACDTGKGVTDYSEGVYGLVRALRTAGAQNVLMTLTSVNGIPTRAFMEKFYDIYLSSEGKLAPSEALHQTRLYFINHPNSEYRKPEIWGPYVMVGR